MAFLSSPSGLGVSMIAILIGAIIFTSKKPKFPIINKHPKDFFRRPANHKYKIIKRKLLKDGAAKYGENPFNILVPNGVKTILPPSRVNWAKNNKDLDHQQLIRDEYFASYPGFDVQHVLHHPNRMVINMVQGKLSKTDKILPVMNEHIKAGLSDIWGEEKCWKTLNWEDGTTGVISRAAASIFVGLELAADPEWQRVSRAYVLDYFRAVVQRRLQEEQEAKVEGSEPPSYYDAIAWTLESPLGNEFESAAVQLALAMAVLFPLRSSFDRSSLRLPATLHEGDSKTNPIAIDSREMYDPAKFTNPEEFGAWRFYKRRQAGDNTSLFVQSSPEHAQFGMGKHICPGRFFAGSELKLCLAHIILKYDIRLKEGCLGKPMQFGFLSATDPFTQLEVRRR
ncbi:cytochrome P450 monooxygenase monooxygenase (lovA) [Fusarium sp. NRRL 52700]|nr:cytochrome P450 monooxygenase monooxygenase (lovA) [Fusarium sp. NRRL 52700]